MNTAIILSGGGMVLDLVLKPQSNIWLLAISQYSYMHLKHLRIMQKLMKLLLSQGRNGKVLFCHG